MKVRRKTENASRKRFVDPKALFFYGFVYERDKLEKSATKRGGKRPKPKTTKKKPRKKKINR